MPRRNRLKPVTRAAYVRTMAVAAPLKPVPETAADVEATLKSNARARQLIDQAEPKLRARLAQLRAQELRSPSS